MAEVVLYNKDVTLLELALPQIAVSPPSRTFIFPEGTIYSGLTEVAYDSFYPVPSVRLIGTGFTFDAKGLLTGGTVTVVENVQPRPSGSMWISVGRTI